MASVQIKLLQGFDDPLLGPESWNRLAQRGDTNTIFQTWQWQRAWWESVGRGTLLLVAALCDDDIVALGPLYADEGMIFFLGCGESDYLDFIGDVGDPVVLDAILDKARNAAPDFVGFKFHWLVERSRTGPRLQAAARRLDLEYVVEATLPAVEVDLAGESLNVRSIMDRSMKKREDHFRTSGSFLVRQYCDTEAIKPQLEEYYAQHVARWSVKPSPSPFADPGQRRFVERFLDLAATTGWVRFLRLDWQGKPLAFELAWYYQGTHYSAPWCFAIELARHCPGHVLLRQSVLAALDQGLAIYDLGAGDQEYKFRLPARVKELVTVGLY